MSNTTAITIDQVRSGLLRVEDLTAFAIKYRLPLRTLMRIKSPTTASARQKNLEKVAKALAKHEAAQKG